ncbi:MAG: hypothetical protein PF569_06585 [Candidatus Woesearchaeota archaeon]|jgi:hypothetical protein|nr:hypothetical protein [Candidatus Woesearchaeota archaeon]
MFELEFIELLNNYKELTDGYEKNKTNSSIINMVKQNPNEYQKFTSSSLLAGENKIILENIEKQIEEEKTKEQFTSSDDVSNIRNYYIKWLDSYKSNNNQVNEVCEKIVKSLLHSYFQNRYTIIEKILEVKQDEEYEAFKWHLKNQLRAYFANEIQIYVESEEYSKLSFFKRYRKKGEVKSLLLKIGNYDFNKKKIAGVIGKE